MLNKYKCIATAAEVSTVNEEEYSRLCKLAVRERGYIMKGREDVYADMIAQRAVERVFVGATYKNESLVNKTILVAQIVFPNTASFIHSTNSFDAVGSEKIIHIAKFFRKAKELSLKDDLTDEEKNLINNIDIYFEYISKQMIRYYGKVTPIAYICKANETMAFHSDLISEEIIAQTEKKRVKSNGKK